MTGKLGAGLSRENRRNAMEKFRSDAVLGVVPRVSDPGAAWEKGCHAPDGRE
ncbi:MAG: hypothetical protein HZA88_18270 [Verrucomicrobia bacterium]|nr:hypothetical protein [Verrucomicrobiota bacterium]